MSSSGGLVAKKIALFEFHPTTNAGLEQKCRLKRKHAIRRKRSRSGGTRVARLSRSSSKLAQKQSLMSLSSEDEIVAKISFFRNKYAGVSLLSASCSALDKEVDTEEETEEIVEHKQVQIESKCKLPSLSLSHRLLKCSSLENVNNRLSKFCLVDIDIDNSSSSSDSLSSNSQVLTSSSNKVIENQLKSTSTLKVNESCSVIVNSSENNANISSSCNRADRFPATSTTTSVVLNNNSSSGYECSNDSQNNFYENVFTILSTKTLVECHNPSSANKFQSKECYQLQKHERDHFSTTISTTSSKSSETGSLNNNHASNITSINLSDSNFTLDPEEKNHFTNNDNNEDNDEEPFYEELYDYCQPNKHSHLEQPSGNSYDDNDNGNNNYTRSACNGTSVDEEDDYADCMTVYYSANVGNDGSSSSCSDNCNSSTDERSNSNGNNARVSIAATRSLYNVQSKKGIIMSNVTVEDLTKAICQELSSRGVIRAAHTVDVIKKDEDSHEDAADESLYAEPTYNGGSTNTVNTTDTNNAVNNPLWKSASSSNSSSNGSSHYAPGTIIRPSSSSSSATTPAPNANYIYNDSISSFDDVPSVYGYVDQKLPPTPQNKFTSIAKVAGRKLAKKLLSIRRLSKSEIFDSSNNTGPTSLSSSTTSGTGSVYDIYADSAPVQTYNGNNARSTNVESNYSSGKSNGNVSHGEISQHQKPPMKRSLSRPNIPPPEPPAVIKQQSPIVPVTDKSFTKPETIQKDISSSSLTPPPLPPLNKTQNLYNDDSIVTNGYNSTYGKESPITTNGSNSKTNGRNSRDDDFDDSDFYDSDTDLIRNFVSQVQPIYSMDEPLYQYYTYGISLKPDDDYQPIIPKNLGLTLDMLVPRGGQRTLWCELPEVTSSGILSILSDKQKQLQEAIFEILTSEVSYMKSLDVLISLFYKNEELIGILSEEERGYVFGNIVQVKECAQSFLAELLGKWEESWYIHEIGEIINRNAKTRFLVYKDYCRNKPYQDRVMQQLRHSRDEFVRIIKIIEEDPKCQMLQIDSFLMLPMQRITRLPLLVNAIIQRSHSAKEKSFCEQALKSLTHLVLACNEEARQSQGEEETTAMLSKIEFSRGLRSPDINSLGQFVMKGDFMKNPFDSGRASQINWTFRKNRRTFYWLLLFTKQLLIAKKKTNDRFEVVEIMASCDCNVKSLPNLEGVSKDFPHYFMLHFNRKETVYFLAARTSSEVERWKSKLETLKTIRDFNVEAIFPYQAQRADELSFYAGDLIYVSQAQPDGWYYGTKPGTSESGWFPGNYGVELSQL